MSLKSALDLLADYGGDSSDEEVPGSRASTKRLRKDDDDEPHTKRHERLPVPNFTRINNLEEVHEEDASLHEGRVRSFPHERGNWATYVYIPFDGNEDLCKLLEAILESVPEEINLNQIDHFHISLTKTVILKYHWIESFVSTLRENLCTFPKFILMFNSLNIYCNEERTRTFIGLEVVTGLDSLLGIIHSLDDCLKDFRLPVFYKDPSFHMSIAWCLGDYEDKLKSNLANLNQILQQIVAGSPQENWYIHVDKLLMKTGNKFFQFNLC